MSTAILAGQGLLEKRIDGYLGVTVRHCAIVFRGLIVALLCVYPRQAEMP